MEINDLPLHVLVVHAAVVFAPLGVLAGLGYAAVPRWREWLRWPMVVTVVVAAGAIWAAYYTGVDFRDDERFATAQGVWLERLETHEDRGSILRWVASGYAAIALAAVWLHNRTGATRVVLGLLVAAGAVATGVYTFLTGEAGARAVWAPV